MDSRALCSCLLAVAITATLACGSDSSSTGGTKKGSFTSSCNSGSPCTADTSAYEQCLIGKCDGELSACYGPSYKSGSFSGPCGEYTNCILACPCDTAYNSCMMQCYPKATQACADCGKQVTACINASGCQSPCSGDAGSAGGGAGQGGSAGASGTVTCAQLAECCQSLPEGQARDGCLGVSQSGNEAQCAQTGAYICK